MVGETGEAPPEVVAPQPQAPEAAQQQAQPKESFLTRLTKFKNNVLGRPPQPTAPQTEQPKAQPLSVPPEPTEHERKAFGAFAEGGKGIIPPSEQLGEKPPGWLEQQQQERQAATAEKTPEQLAKEAIIDAENLAKLEQPSQPTEPPPKVAPFITETPQTTTLPEKVFEPQPDVPGEHAEVDEFLGTKPQPSVETPAQPPETAAQAPTGEAIPVESQPREEQPIPVNIPQSQPQTPTPVGVAEPQGGENR